MFGFLTNHSSNLQFTAAVTVKKVSGQVVVNQGEVGSEFFIIVSGELEVRANGQKIRTLGAGDYFGERALLYNELRR